MVSYFQFRRDEFLQHYHKRSNVESTACKRKFGDSVRSKTDTVMVNEVLCKLICLCCLIHEQEELGIVPVFWPEPKEEHPVVPAVTVDAPLSLTLPKAQRGRQVKHVQAILWD
jgi:hypothetical protein